MPRNTRLDNAALKALVDRTITQLDQSLAALKELLPQLTADERKSLLRPPDGFPAKARDLMSALDAAPDLAKLAGCEPEAVREDLTNVDTIAGISARAHEVAQILDDAKLLWLHEAYADALAAHRIAGAAGETNPALRTVADALAPMFGGGRRRKKG